MGYAGSQFHRGPNYLQDPLTPLTVQSFCNTKQTVTLTCPEGTTGDPVTSTVEAGSLCGYSTQEAADAAALAQAQAEAEAQRVLNPCVSPLIPFGWGYGGFGAVGNDATSDEYSPVAIDTDEWDSICSGNDANFAFGVKGDGTLWSWGDNGQGQLGLGDTAQKNAPVQVGTDTNWNHSNYAVGTGALHSLMLKADGTLWATGDNQYGQLGDGTTTDQHSPIQIGADTDWEAVSCGSLFSAALKSDGTLWAWGNNQHGQCGTGDTTENHAPTQVGVGTDWTFVAAGGLQLFAIKTDGTLWATGYNNNGQLGLGDSTERLSLTQVGTDVNWAVVSAGREHTLAVKTTGTLWTWGWNVFGQLGQGNTDSVDVPTQVGALTTWEAVAGGNFFSMARKTDGTLWGTGDNGLGELGTGDGSPSTESFVQAGTDDTWTIIATGKQNGYGLHT